MANGDDSGETTYENVRNKKAEGKLSLTEDAMTFHSTTTTPFSWSTIVKHQVSPASHPKCLLKFVFSDGKSNTYQFSSREELERIRRDISNRLQNFRSSKAPSGNSKKRSHSEINMPPPTSPLKAATSYGKTTTRSFGELDSTATAVTRSSLLAANPTLRAQHQYLVQETETVTEEDFWKTHRDLLEEEYARICGMTRAGTSSLLQSHLQLLTGRVTLGVEEMRQIFILYPAVHKAYEEKVPLELSDEQFWRKYLESEYFHRDRGRIGAASRRDDKKDAEKRNKGGLSLEDQEARAAAVGTDDLFSRYDQKIRESTKSDDGSRKWGTKLAVGQFDLASTFETERGNLLEGPRDNHPPNASDDGKGGKVIQKYNRHWAMVLHPNDAVAGSDLMQVARRSVTEVLPGDEDAKAGGGIDADMTRLVDFAKSSSEEANHALGIGLEDSDEYERLALKNIEAYYSSQPSASSTSQDDAQRKKNMAIFANKVVEKMNELGQQRGTQFDDAFPPVELGKGLMVALTKKMAEDSKTDADALEVVKTLPDDFKKRLHSYFRRSSELLRHFFGLRRLTEGGNNAYNEKLNKVVARMKNVYEEMDEMRKSVTATSEIAEIMRKMCLQIMDQLDWAFKLYGGGGPGGGGSITIETF